MKRKRSSRPSRSTGNKPKLVIKKYSDRRLYDPSASRYVNLDDIARLVRDGVDVKVVDARSGQDLTYVVFSQIILEGARERERGLPLQLLQQLVRSSDKATHDFLSWYLDSTLDLYQNVQSRIREGLPEAKSIVARPVEFLRNLLAGQTWPPTSTTDESQRLRQRVKELEAQLAARKRSAPRARKKRAAH